MMGKIHVETAFEQSFSDFIRFTIAENKIQAVDANGQLYTADLGTKTATAVQLGSQSINAATFVGTTLYYADATGVTQVETTSSSLRLTTGLTETKVEGLDDTTILSMVSVNGKVLFSGQDDNSVAYVTDVISVVHLKTKLT